MLFHQVYTYICQFKKKKKHEKNKQCLAVEKYLHATILGWFFFVCDFCLEIEHLFGFSISKIVINNLGCIKHNYISGKNTKM